MALEDTKSTYEYKLKKAGLTEPLTTYLADPLDADRLKAGFPAYNIDGGGTVTGLVGPDGELIALGGGSGSSTYVGLSDAATANLPSVNTPLSGALAAKQATLVSGTNVKTVNGQTLLGAGDLVVTGVVTSVASRTGAVVLTKTDVGLANVDNTADADKPISTATSTALAGKATTAQGAKADTALQPKAPAAFTARALTNADDGTNLICGSAQVATVNTGLSSGFGCSFKGGITFNGTATVTDVRTTGATNPWCSLIQTSVDVYDVVGTKA